MTGDFPSFDLELRKVPITVGGKAYTIIEASGDTAVKYNNAMLNATRMGSDGKPTGFNNLANIEPYLVSMCLLDEEGKKVPEATIKSWPSRVVKEIYKRIKDISELDARDEEPAKNVPETSMDGSD